MSKVSAMRRLVPMLLVAAMMMSSTERVTGQAKKKKPDGSTAISVEELPENSPAWLEGYRVRWPVRVVGNLGKQDAKSVIAVVPTGGWLKPDAGDLAVQADDGTSLPLRVLSHDPAGDTLLQFPRTGNDAYYWVYGGHADPPEQKRLQPEMREGLTVEVRNWAGDDLGSWAKVRDGLMKSETVIGNSLVADVIQIGNPARPKQTRRFAASYRGYLDVPKEGVYRFFVNNDDAAFLFIDGFKVFEHPGANIALAKLPRQEIDKRCARMELKAGLHALEVHHVVGNNEHAQGVCSLLWGLPGSEALGPVPRTAFPDSLQARAVAVERAKKGPIALFEAGIDDALVSGPIRLYLVRFEALGSFEQADTLTWNFGDGTSAVGRSVRHVYWRAGDFPVKLTCGDGTAFERIVSVWRPAGSPSPFSLDYVLRGLRDLDWKKIDTARRGQIYEFLVNCEQPERWELLESITRTMLASADIDPEMQVQLIAVRMEALGRTGRGKEAVQLAEQTLPKFAKVPSIQLRIQLALASVYQYQLRDATQASKIYKTILEDFARVEHPSLRIAAIRWGDLFAESGEITRAGEMYRQAVKLGGEKFAHTAQVDAVTRGARLRIAEQKLRDGDIRVTLKLLEEIELDYPEQKLEGLYRFLRAEADRFGGHYEEALRSYEVLLKLPQWSSYRDRATHGIADTYYRMNDLEQARKWFAKTKASFGAYAAKHKLDDMIKVIDRRLQRRKDAKDKDDFLTEYHTGFEPEEPPSSALLNHLFPQRGLGMDGRHLAVHHNFPPFTGVPTFKVTLRNLNSGGQYWVEAWVRATGLSIPGGKHPRVESWFRPLDLNKESPTPGFQSADIVSVTRPGWRKISFKLTAPMLADAEWRFTLVDCLQGTFEIDALSIRAVSDRQNDSLASFLEGPEE